MTATAASLTPSRPIPSTDLIVSPLGLGGNVFGWTADRDASFAVLDAYRAAGGNFIDTADSYSHWLPGHVGGESETIIGQWFAARGCRAEFVVATKVAKLPSAPGLSPANIAASCEGSLRRLGTDHIDLYYAHQDDPDVPLEATIAAFDALVRAGKVRHVAASNFGAERLRASIDLARREGLAPYVATQDQYNLMERGRYEEQIAPVVAETGIASFPFYGLARGFLTGKYAASVSIDSPRAPVAAAYLDTPRGERVLDVLTDVAATHGVRPASVALAWLLARPGITAPLASARSTDQLADLVAVGTLALTADELARLTAASAT